MSDSQDECKFEMEVSFLKANATLLLEEVRRHDIRNKLYLLQKYVHLGLLMQSIESQIVHMDEYHLLLAFAYKQIQQLKQIVKHEIANNDLDVVQHSESEIQNRIQAPSKNIQNQGFTQNLNLKSQSQELGQKNAQNIQKTGQNPKQCQGSNQSLKAPSKNQGQDNQNAHGTRNQGQNQLGGKNNSDQEKNKCANQSYCNRNFHSDKNNQFFGFFSPSVDCSQPFFCEQCQRESNNRLLHSFGVDNPIRIIQCILEGQKITFEQFLEEYDDSQNVIGEIILKEFENQADESSQTSFKDNARQGKNPQKQQKQQNLNQGSVVKSKILQISSVSSSIPQTTNISVFNFDCQDEQSVDFIGEDDKKKLVATWDKIAEELVREEEEEKKLQQQRNQQVKTDSSNNTTSKSKKKKKKKKAGKTAESNKTSEGGNNGNYNVSKNGNESDDDVKIDPEFINYVVEEIAHENQFSVLQDPTSVADTSTKSQNQESNTNYQNNGLNSSNKSYNDINLVVNNSNIVIDDTILMHSSNNVIHGSTSDSQEPGNLPPNEKFTGSSEFVPYLLPFQGLPLQPGNHQHGLESYDSVPQQNADILNPQFFSQHVLNSNQTVRVRQPCQEELHVGNVQSRNLDMRQQDDGQNWVVDRTQMQGEEDHQGISLDDLLPQVESQEDFPDMDDLLPKVGSPSPSASPSNDMLNWDDLLPQTQSPSPPKHNSNPNNLQALQNFQIKPQLFQNFGLNQNVGDSNSNMWQTSALRSSAESSISQDTQKTPIQNPDFGDSNAWISSALRSSVGSSNFSSYSGNNFNINASGDLNSFVNSLSSEFLVAQQQLNSQVQQSDVNNQTNFSKNLLMEQNLPISNVNYQKCFASQISDNNNQLNKRRDLQQNFLSQKQFENNMIDYSKLKFQGQGNKNVDPGSYSKSNQNGKQTKKQPANKSKLQQKQQKQLRNQQTQKTPKQLQQQQKQQPKQSLNQSQKNKQNQSQSLQNKKEYFHYPPLKQVPKPFVNPWETFDKPKTVRSKPRNSIAALDLPTQYQKFKNIQEKYSKISISLMEQLQAQYNCEEDAGEDLEGECPICLEKENGVEFHPCLHRFCLQCALAVRKRSNECPLCRGVIIDTKMVESAPVNNL